MSWKDIIDKINIAEISGGGLDIISATSLPATGKENQICIINENSEYPILVTTNHNESISEPTQVVYLGNISNSDVGTEIQIKNMKLYFNKVIFDNDRLASYYWSNNQWNQLTLPSINIMKNGNIVTELISDYNFHSNVSYTPGSYVSIYGISSYYVGCTSKNIIDFTNISRIEINAYSSASSKSLYIASYKSNASVYVNSATTALPAYYYDKITLSTTSKTYIFDVSSWNGQGYFSVCTNGSGYYAYITDIKFY